MLRNDVLKIYKGLAQEISVEVRGAGNFRMDVAPPTQIRFRILQRLSRQVVFETTAVENFGKAGSVVVRIPATALNGYLAGLYDYALTYRRGTGPEMPLYLDEAATLFGTVEIVSSPLGREIQQISFGAFSEISRAPDPASGADIGIGYASEIVSLIDRNLQGLEGEVSINLQDFTGTVRIQTSEVRPLANSGWQTLFEQSFVGQDAPVTYSIPIGTKYLRVSYFIPTVGGTGQVLGATLTI
jgi:hypothetical protein